MVPDNVVTTDFRGLNIVLTDTRPQQVGTLTATVEGAYRVGASGTGSPIILRFLYCFFIYLHRPTQTVPETPFGTISVATAMLGATGLFIKRKTSKSKK